MRDIEKDFLDILLANEDLALVPGKSVVAGLAPDSASDELVRVALISGSGENYHSDSDLWTVSVSVEVRGKRNDYVSALERANQVFGVLHRAKTNVYASISCPNLPAFEDEDEKGRPIFSFEVVARFTTQSANQSLVVLEGNGNLDVASITFADGSILESAPDTSELVTLTGNQTLSHKILEDLIVSGPIYPAEQGQTIGTEASPFGQLFLKTRAAGHVNVPLRIDGANHVNTRSLEIINFGAGSSGIYMESAPTGANRGSLQIGTPNTSGYGFMSRPFALAATHRGLAFLADAKGADTNHHAFAFHDKDDERTVLRVQGASGRAGKLQEWGTYDGTTKHVSTWIEADGTVETVAGVILHSPNGSRFRITVADDGSLSAQEVP